MDHAHALDQPLTAYSRENGESYIYANVDWKDAPTATAVTLIITLFVGMPIVVCLIRLCFYVRGVHKSEGMQVQIHAV